MCDGIINEKGTIGGLIHEGVGGGSERGGGGGRREGKVHHPPCADPSKSSPLDSFCDMTYFIELDLVPTVLRSRSK